MLVLSAYFFTTMGKETKTYFSSAFYTPWNILKDPWILSISGEYAQIDTDHVDIVIHKATYVMHTSMHTHTYFT